MAPLLFRLLDPQNRRNKEVRETAPESAPNSERRAHLRQEHGDHRRRNVCERENDNSLFQGCLRRAFVLENQPEQLGNDGHPDNRVRRIQNNKKRNTGALHQDVLVVERVEDDLVGFRAEHEIPNRSRNNRENEAHDERAAHEIVPLRQIRVVRDQERENNPRQRKHEAVNGERVEESEVEDACLHRAVHLVVREEDRTLDDHHHAVEEQAEDGERRRCVQEVHAARTREGNRQTQRVDADDDCATPAASPFRPPRHLEPALDGFRCGHEVRDEQAVGEDQREN